MCYVEAKDSTRDPDSKFIYGSNSKVTITKSKGGSTLVTLPRDVTPYRDSVDGTRDRVTSKVGYAVTLRACAVRCRYLAVTSKG